MTAFLRAFTCIRGSWGSDKPTPVIGSLCELKLTFFLHKRTPLVCRAPRAFLIRFLIFLDIIDHVNVYFCKFAESVCGSAIRASFVNCMA